MSTLESQSVAGEGMLVLVSRCDRENGGYVFHGRLNETNQNVVMHVESSAPSSRPGEIEVESVDQKVLSAMRNLNNIGLISGYQGESLVFNGAEAMEGQSGHYKANSVALNTRRFG